VAGDQQAALFGQACFEPGMAKVTYGTGSFVLLNAGPTCPAPAEGLLTTVAWDLGDKGGVTYALEGAVFATGAAIQWLRDGLGIIGEAAEIGPLAARCQDSGGVVVVPAFAGMGSPWWDPYARGTILGLSRGSGAPQLARAVIEAMAYQVRDVVDAMSEVLGRSAAVLRADGGAAVLDLLLQLQADQLQVPVARPTTTETTGLGAATLAGLAEGVWGSLEELGRQWELDRAMTPAMPPELAAIGHGAWLRAVDRARGWARPAEV
jgi:glycerol kinase